MRRYCPGAARLSKRKVVVEFSVVFDGLVLFWVNGLVVDWVVLFDGEWCLDLVRELLLWFSSSCYWFYNPLRGCLLLRLIVMFTRDFDVWLLLDCGIQQIVGVFGFWRGKILHCNLDVENDMFCPSRLRVFTLKS
ncbi:hypothetical protein Droror1_Dr00006863 [Drosera rotundifolia]